MFSTALFGCITPIPLFPYKRYKQFRRFSNILTENNIVPIKIVKEKLYEVDIKEDIYTEEEAIEMAINEAEKKLKEKNSNIVDIKKIDVLNRQNLNSKVKLSLFASVIEDISEIIEIHEEMIENN